MIDTYISVVDTSLLHSIPGGDMDGIYIAGSRGVGWDLDESHFAAS
jgi:hypothetical protein